MEASRAVEQSARSLLEQLYERHARDVYQYALALMANPADAEDVTQTTFLNAYRALERGDRPHRPHNWLIAIAHNVCRMRWRQAGHRPKETPLDDAPEPVAQGRDDQPSIDDVLRALSRLSFNQRSALVMRELEGRSCKEISQTLGLSVSAVEALLFRARRRLQIERKAIGVLGTAPLPAQIAGALGIGGGGGGGAVATGVVALGGDAVLKGATALVVAGAIASGAVAIAKPAPRHQPAVPLTRQARQVHQPATPIAKRAAAHRPARPKRAKPRANPPASSTQKADGATSTQAAPLPALQLPKLPKLPLPPPPVQLPSLPVQVPQPPLIPPVPPLPPLPPL
ncbi:MAG TPA: sigma-70 family RNA polymerase sigma factor [Gaiellaceae bacterium]|nr:sigma-70 family RNA polymerase sigma factor [Gaiellaceae bacterium]